MSALLGMKNIMGNHIIFYNWKVNTGNPFRSSDLGVMSPARFLCAMPVNGFFGLKSLKDMTTKF